VRTGVRLGVDGGSRRVGVARSDALGMLAVPVVTLDRGRGDLDALADLVAEYEVLEVIVGMPLGLDGSPGAAAGLAQDYAREVAMRVHPVAVRTIDERLTTVTAQRGLQEAGRTTRDSRSVIDQAAAVVIVQHALDAERASGAPCGALVEVET